ncbi:MAG: hypothetical protein M1814_000607 [Vezdaea aestivalis]|nr:MAG: hypothetical protein M1814_000607 [Vezdaea aestivalis]
MAQPIIVDLDQWGAGGVKIEDAILESNKRIIGDIARAQGYTYVQAYGELALKYKERPFKVVDGEQPTEDGDGIWPEGMEVYKIKAFPSAKDFWPQGYFESTKSLERTQVPNYTDERFLLAVFAPAANAPSNTWRRARLHINRYHTVIGGDAPQWITPQELDFSPLEPWYDHNDYFITPRTRHLVQNIGSLHGMNEAAIRKGLQGVDGKGNIIPHDTTRYSAQYRRQNPNKPEYGPDPLGVHITAVFKHPSNAHTTYPVHIYPTDDTLEFFKRMVWFKPTATGDIHNYNGE